MPDNGNSGDKDYTSLINGNGTWKNEQGTKTQGCFVEYSVSAVPVPAAVCLFDSGFLGLLECA